MTRAKDTYSEITDPFRGDMPNLNISKLAERQDLPTDIDQIPPILLYGDDDFNIPARRACSESGLKVGNLFIKYCPEGKGSFHAEVYYLNKPNKQKYLLFKFDNQRYSGFDFESLFPYPLGNGLMTIIGPSSAEPDRTRELMINELAKRVRPFILEMAFGKEVNRADFQIVLADLLTFRQNSIERISPRTSQEHHLDVSDFQRDPSRKPPTQPSLAAKIAYLYYTEFGIENAQLELVINEYLEASGKTIKQLDAQWSKDLLDSPIDQNRYTLLMILPKEVLKICIDNIKKIRKIPAKPDNGFSVKPLPPANISALSQEEIDAHFLLWQSINLFGDERKNLESLYAKGKAYVVQNANKHIPGNTSEADRRIAIDEWSALPGLEQDEYLNWERDYNVRVSDVMRDEIAAVAKQILEAAKFVFFSNDSEKLLHLNNLEELLTNFKKYIEDHYGLPPRTLNRFNRVLANFHQLSRVIESNYSLSDSEDSTQLDNESYKSHQSEQDPSEVAQPPTDSPILSGQAGLPLPIDQSIAFLPMMCATPVHIIAGMLILGGIAVVIAASCSTSIPLSIGIAVGSLSVVAGMGLGFFAGRTPQKANEVVVNTEQDHPNLMMQ